MKGDDISERLLNFAVRILRVAEALPKTVAGRHVSGQLVRCGTSAGANYEEARGGESRDDFVHKLAVSWKEMRESMVESLIQEAFELCKVLGSSHKTASARA